MKKFNGIDIDAPETPFQIDIAGAIKSFRADKSVDRMKSAVHSAFNKLFPESDQAAFNAARSEHMSRSIEREFASR